MKPSALFRLATAALLSCGIAGCQTPAAINGSGYQMVRFSNVQAARLAAEDTTAGPAIHSNNRQCQQDAGCRK